MSKNEFISKHAQIVTGSLTCFDRVILKGYLPIHHPGGMEGFLAYRGVLIKDLKPFVLEHSAAVKAHAQAMAERYGRPFQYLSGHHRKEDLARTIAAKDGITSGLVCVFSIVEQTQSFRLIYGQGRPRLATTQPRTLCLYYYFIDETLGLIHVRVPTWFPFPMQVYVNGHEWLARQLDRRGLGYRRVDNAIVDLDNPIRTQKLANRFSRINWKRHLDRLARMTNPHIGKLLGPLNYYWCIDQAELSTDVMFKRPEQLSGLFDRLLPNAALTIGADDIMTFLGRKLTGHFQGTIQGRMVRRWPGARIKHSMKRNWIKMYNKEGIVLRIETVINDPREFKIRRAGMRYGKKVIDWYPMGKRVANMERYAEVALAANERYMQVLSTIDDPTAANQFLHELGSRKTEKGNSVRALNPLSMLDAGLLSAVFRGEHSIRGFKSSEIAALMGWRKCSALDERRRQSARLNRLLRVLRGHRLIARIQRTRRYRLTEHGAKLIGAMIYFREKGLYEALGVAA